MKDHIFEQLDRPVTLGAHFESEPRVMEGPPACPVCGTVVDLEAIEHSIRSKPLRATEGEAPSSLLMCTMPCFKESCPVYLRLEVTISEEEYETWKEKPDCRLDHTHFRDNRPVTLEAQAEESVTATPPYNCPVCLKALDLAAMVPLPKILISGIPLPRPNEPPQHRATAYAPCPHCGARLTCSRFLSIEEIKALQPDPRTSDNPPQ